MQPIEDRFNCSDGPVRVIFHADTPPRELPEPETVEELRQQSRFQDGHLRNGGGLEQRPRYSGKSSNKPKPVESCIRAEGHFWKSKGADAFGTRLVFCPHCRRHTTAANAGVDLPPVKTRLEAKVVPLGGEAPCVNPEGHKWHRNGTVRGVKRIKCARQGCDVRSKDKSVSIRKGKA